jgi:hypothetical protein
MYLRVNRFAVTLPTRSALDDRVAVTWLGISGLTGAELPTADGSKVIKTDFLVLTSENHRGSQGLLTLDLTEALPAGTKVALSATDSSGRYLLELSDSIPGMSIGVVGPVEVRSENGSTRLSLKTPVTVRITPDRGTLGIEFKPVPAGRRLFTQQLPAHGLDLIKVNRVDSPSGTTLEEKSTILGGHFTIGNADPRELTAAEEVRAAGVRGQLSNVWLDGDHLELMMRGSVQRLFTGAADVREDLTPSLLDWLRVDHPIWVALAAAAYVLVAALVLTVRSTRVR